MKTLIYILLILIILYSIFFSVYIINLYRNTEVEGISTQVTNYLPTNKDKTIEGEASYYDYVLKGGWSSVGHYVCATRDFIRYRPVEVTNLDNGKKVICKVTDYGPEEAVFPERIIDLSSTSFFEIADNSKQGVLNVAVRQL